MVAYTRRDGHELDNMGDNNSSNTDRTTPNPQDSDANAVLAKLVFTPVEGHILRLTYDHEDSAVDTHVLSAIAKPPLGASSTLDLLARDEDRRDRISFDHRFDNLLELHRQRLVGRLLAGKHDAPIRGGGSQHLAGSHAHQHVRQSRLRFQPVADQFGRAPAGSPTPLSMAAIFPKPIRKACVTAPFRRSAKRFRRAHSRPPITNSPASMCRTRSISEPPDYRCIRRCAGIPTALIPNPTRSCRHDGEPERFPCLAQAGGHLHDRRRPERVCELRPGVQGAAAERSQQWLLERHHQLPVYPEPESETGDQ